MIKVKHEPWERRLVTRIMVDDETALVYAFDGLLTVEFRDVSSTVRVDEQAFSWLPYMVYRDAFREIRKETIMPFIFKIGEAVVELQRRYKLMGELKEVRVKPRPRKGRLVLTGGVHDD